MLVPVQSESDYSRTAVVRRDRYCVWSPSAVLRVPVGDRATVQAEYFAFFSQGRATDFRQQFLSTGASYLLTPDLEVGVRGGPGADRRLAELVHQRGVRLAVLTGGPSQAHLFQPPFWIVSSANATTNPCGRITRHFGTDFTQRNPMCDIPVSWSVPRRAPGR